MATEKAIGINKVDIMKERINSINSRAEVLSLSEFLNIETIENILKETQKIDFCIEAIDSLNPKTKVIKSLLKYNIPFISSMGAGGRISPFMVKEGTLNEVKTCDLAKRLKKKLKKEHINIEEIKVVYSTEKAKKPVARQTWEEGEFQRGRIRGKQGSICFVPAVFGMCMAYIAIRYITEKIDF